MVDVLDFSAEIHSIKAQMMRLLGIERRGFFLFQFRSGDFGNAKGETLLDFMSHGVKWRS